MLAEQYKKLLHDYEKSKTAFASALHESQTSKHVLTELQRYKEYNAVLLADFLLEHNDSTAAKEL